VVDQSWCRVTPRGCIGPLTTVAHWALEPNLSGYPQLPWLRNPLKDVLSHCGGAGVALVRRMEES